MVDFWVTLQPTEIFLQPPIIFKVGIKYKFINNVKNIGLLSHWVDFYAYSKLKKI